MKQYTSLSLDIIIDKNSCPVGSLVIFNSVIVYPNPDNPVDELLPIYLWTAAVK